MVEEGTTAVECLFALNDRFHPSSARPIHATYLLDTQELCDLPHPEALQPPQ